jgi:hypothetical protein
VYMQIIHYMRIRTYDSILPPSATLHPAYA